MLLGDLLVAFLGGLLVEDMGGFLVVLPIGLILINFLSWSWLFFRSMMTKINKKMMRGGTLPCTL